MSIQPLQGLDQQGPDAPSQTLPSATDPRAASAKDTVKLSHDGRVYISTFPALLIWPLLPANHYIHRQLIRKAVPRRI